MISKELLSEVLGAGVEFNEEDVPLLNTVRYEIVRGLGARGKANLNIHELAHKCKEWALGRGCEILS